MPTPPLDSQANVFACFARQADARPDALAVIDEQGSTTYGELAARADRVARHLLANGLAPEQPVGVLMSRRTELLAVLLGVWQAGGAYVPFDPRDPADRIRRMQASCGCTLVLGDADLVQALRAACDADGTEAPQTVVVATIPDASGNVAPLASPDGGARLAYLLFTSGSTGEPKAVEVEHRQVMALLQSAREMLQLTAHDRYLAASTIAFDASITELFLPLATGACVVLRDRAILLDPHGLAQAVRAHGVTVLQTGPSVWQVLLSEVPDFPHVRVAITHGEAVAPALAKRIALQGDDVWNLYGPTETTVWATAARLRPDDAPGLSTTSAPIGRPLPHVRALILDDQGNAAPYGTAGELCLGGPSVARGYRNNEVLTRERFITVGGERVYRSGDVAVRDADGVLHYFGRNDDQIKVRGVRVEPGEVEAAVLRDSRVAQVAATWFTNRHGGRSIVAAVVLRPRASCRAQDLHEGLTARLPSAMIPARFLFVPWLPMTSSGKVDRKAIRQEAETTTVDDANGVTQSTPAGTRQRALTNTERAMATIWERMLGVPAVAPDDHFFTIGGDSLAAVQMMVEVEGRFGLVLPVHLAFEAPTLETLARRVERAQEAVEDEATTGFVFELVPSVGGTPVFFSGVELSLARRGLWTLPCPLYAIALWAKGSGFVQQASLTSLAASHLESIRRLQPKGPYRLAGFSLGGLIAYEMAQQLRAAGEVVEMLFLLDPMAPYTVVLTGSGGRPTSTMPEQDHRASVHVRIGRHLRRVARGPGEKGVAAWVHKALLLDRMALLDWLHYLAVNHFLRHPNAASRALFPRDRWRAFWFAGRRLVRRYTATAYDGPVLAVFTKQDRRGEIWSALLRPDTERHALDVPHLALFEEPTLGQWLGWLAARLNAEPGHAR